jgi:hypothetical protein
VSREFDRFMVHVDVGTDEKLAGLTDAERLCHVVGVLAIAAKSPIRGCLLVGDSEAQPRHVAKRADVSERVARSTLAKLQEVGVLVRDDELGCWRVHNWSKFNPAPKKDNTAAERQRRRRDRLRAVPRHGPVTVESRCDDRDDHANEVEVEVELEEEKKSLGGGINENARPPAATNAIPIGFLKRIPGGRDVA